MHSESTYNKYKEKVQPILFVYKGFAAKDSRIRRVHFLRSTTKQFKVKATFFHPWIPTKD